MTLQLGDRVKIRKASRYYLGSSYNPIDVEGTVDIINEKDCRVAVMWDNSCHNGYEESDLELVNSDEIKENYEIF